MNGSSSTSRLQSRKEASRKSLSTSTVGIVVASGVVVVSLLSLLVGILVAFASRKQNKELITATSNLLGVSKQDLVDFASVPLEAMHQYNSNNYNVSSFSGNGNKVLSLVERPTVPNVIGYAISLVKCEDKQSFAAGLIDAALVLRHSVHRTSVRQVGSKSVYDYKMIAFVHTAAQGCADPLKDAGFTIIVKDSPVQKKEIQGEFLLKNIGSEWCCGEKEFIKLYAYTIDDLPIVIHVDMDFVFYQPMDDLFDAMLYSRDSEIGKRARDRIPTEFLKTMHWPERIDAFMTRDWPQVIPGRKSGFQAGFLVIQPNRDVFDILVDVLRKGDYVDGYSRENGWGGLGYGGFVGAKAMQGLLAYVYDVLLNDTWVELNQCRFNHFGMDVRFRAASGFRANHPKAGQCRNDFDYCEDCMVTDLSEIYSIHFNQCRKPWNCIGKGSKAGTFGKTAIPEDQVHLDHCMRLLKVWHDIRWDLESSLLKLTGDKSIDNGSKGDYKKDIFRGHCSGYGGENYLPIAGSVVTRRKISELYINVYR